MKRKVMTGGVVLAAICAVLGWGQSSALALPPFKKEFEDKYVKKDSADPIEKQFAELVKKVEYCGVCHTDKKDRKKRNAYGDALHKYIGKPDAKNAEKIREALDKVAGEPSDPSDPKSPTFGDLIKQGKLPAGEPQ